MGKPKIPYDVVFAEWQKDRHGEHTAARLGISPASVARALKHFGQSQGTGVTHKVPYEEVLRVYYEEGNYPRTADRLGLSKGTVAHIIGNVLGQGKGRGRCRVRRGMNDLPMSEITFRYLFWEETAKEIGDRFGVDSEVIRRRLERSGVKRRRVGARSPEQNYQWKGGYKPTVHYYRRQSYEVAAICLGQPLGRGWVIHHLDENPENNNPENLWIFPSQKEHARYHQRLLKLQREGHAISPILEASRIGGRALPTPRNPILLLPDKDLPVP